VTSAIPRDASIEHTLLRAVVIALLLGTAGTAAAVPGYNTPPAGEAPAQRYAALTRDECEAELRARGVGFERQPPTAGVRAPVRLTGPIRGVLFRGDESAEERARLPYEIADCRLVLALDDFAAILARHGVVEVRHWSMYRPPRRAWPLGIDGKRHTGGLAIDVGWFKLADGTRLEVLDDFHGRRRSKACGKKARPPRPKTAKAVALRALLCEAVGQLLFTVVLTPNHDRRHRNHFHLEVAPRVRWFLFR
jgi:hypothetical protein